jgi:predicted DNA-binding protein
MSETTTAGYSPSYGQTKTLAVRISEDLRAPLDIIAQLNDRTVTEEIRLVIEAWIEKIKADPATKRGAIAAIFDGAPSTAWQSKRRSNSSSGQQGKKRKNPRPWMWSGVLENNIWCPWRDSNPQPFP